MKRFSGIFILLAAIIISATLVYITDRNEKFNKDNFDRYDFYVDSSSPIIIYTFDKFTGDYTKRVLGMKESVKYNDIKD